MAQYMFAKAMGAQKLIGVDITKERCQLALYKKLSDHVFVSEPDVLNKILNLT
jgi:threonine dehydrogenase-like Zn-dependent dehydrogenase